MRKIAIFLVVMVLATPAAWAKEKQGEAWKSIQVYETGSLDQPFKILGKVHSKASKMKRLSDNVRRLAAKNGGDAVLLYKVENTGNISWWSGGQMSYAEGVVVKFDPQGVTEIKPETPIPVLE